MPDLDLPNLTQTMGDVFDAAERGEEYVSPEAVPESQEAQEPQKEAGAEGVRDEQNTDQGDAQEVEQPADAPAPLEPPERWSADDKAAFAALPREAQDLVLKRERDVESYLSRRAQEIGDQGRKYQSIEQILEPRRRDLAAMGLDDATAVRQLFDLYDGMKRDPAGFAKTLAQRAGVALGSEDEDEVITSLRSEVTQLKNMLSQGQQQQAMAQREQLQSVVAQFRDETGENGEPLRPYFSEVEDRMAAIIAGGTAKDLQDAYDQAVWANPATRAKLLEAQRKSEDAKRAAEAKAKAEKAEKTAGTRPRASNGQFVATPGNSIADTMSSVYDSMNG